MSLPRERKQSPAEGEFLFELDPKPLAERLTAYAGIPLFVKVMRSLQIPASVKGHAGRLGFTQAVEIPEFHDLRRPRIHLCKPCECKVELHDFRRLLAEAVELVQRHPCCVTAPLCGVHVPRMVHQHTPQLPGSNGEQVPPVFQLERSPSEDPEIDLMHERCGIERMSLRS